MKNENELYLCIVLKVNPIYGVLKDEHMHEIHV